MRSASLPRPATNIPLLVRSLANRGINRSAIARQLHVAPSTVCRWLNAERSPNLNNGAGLIFLATDFAKRQKR